MAVHWITWQQDGEGKKPRVQARYTQPLERVIEQAEHDRDVNGRLEVRIENAQREIVWPKG